MKLKIVFAVIMVVIAMFLYSYWSKSRWEAYYQNKLYQPPHDIVKIASEMFQTPGIAIDLGCGVGNDAAYLLSQGWKVWALDNEEKAIQLLQMRKDITSYDNIVTINTKFDDPYIWTQLPNADLIYASLSLPFLNKENFENTWGFLKDKIVSGGIFAGHFFGLNYQGFKDREKQGMTFLNKNELDVIFEGFDLEYFQELEEDGASGTGCPIHSHIFEVIARKR